MFISALLSSLATLGVAFLFYMMKDSSLFTMALKILGVFTGPVAAIFLMGLAFRLIKTKVNIAEYST